jgi:hypothetical protein
MRNIAFLILFAFPLFVYATEPAPEPDHVHITAYSAPWCVYCPRMQPVWQRLVDDGYEVGVIENVDAMPAGWVQPASIPLTEVYVMPGWRLRKRFVGVVTYEVIKAEADKDAARATIEEALQKRKGQ